MNGACGVSITLISDASPGCVLGSLAMMGPFGFWSGTMKNPALSPLSLERRALTNEPIYVAGSSTYIGPQKIGISVEDVKAYVSFIKETVGIRHEDELIRAIEI